MKINNEQEAQVYLSKELNRIQDQSVAYIIREILFSVKDPKEINLCEIIWKYHPETRPINEQ